MGQLFWKFLLAFWLALVLAFGAVFTLNQLSQSPEQNRALLSPQGRFFLQNAQQLIDAGGVPLLRTLVQNWQDDPMAREQLLVLDASGTDLLGREVPADIGQNPRTKHLVVQAAGQPLQLVLVNKDNFWQQRAFAMKERLSPRDTVPRERGAPALVAGRARDRAGAAEAAARDLVDRRRGDAVERDREARVVVEVLAEDDVVCAALVRR